MNESEESDGSIEENNEETTTEQKSDVPVNPKGLPRRLRVRYWSSWEEMLLIELWRKHLDEVTDLEKNMPVFRYIANGMKNSGFHVNGQEVRRKIKTIKNKYITEKRSLSENEDKEAKSKWRLFPLVDLLFTPEVKKFEPLSEEKALKSILQLLKADPLYKILSSGLPVASTLERIEAGENVFIPPAKNFEDSFPVENKNIAASIKLNYENKTKRSFTPRTVRPCESAAQRAKIPQIRQPATATATENQTPLRTTNPNVLNSSNRGPLKRIATENSIKQLRLENKRLAEECVIASKQLKMEEQQLKAFEKIITQIQSQYESLSKNFVVN